MQTSNIGSNQQTKELLREFLNKTLKDVMSALKAECGSLFLFEQDGGNLVLDSLYNSCQLPSIKGLKIRKGEGVAGKVVDLKMPVLVRDIDSDPRFRANGHKHYQTKSFISIPLLSSQGLIGLMNIADKSNKEPFSDKDFKFAVLLCDYACLNVDNLINHRQTEKENQALEKFASVGKLAAGVVHEINNPLDGMLRYTNLLLAKLDHNPTAREYLLEIKNGLGRIEGITKSLLNFSHVVNSERAKLRCKKMVDIHKVIEECLDLLKTKFPENVKVHKDYGKDLPQVWDLGLFHIFMNMFKNSIDAMPNGGLLEIRTELKGRDIEINIKDTGLGISRDDLENLFEPFFTTKSIDKGCGLGMVICKEIVKRYNGKIGVQSLEGKGTTFTVLIPCDNG